MDEYLDKYFFVSYVNRYKKYYDGMLKEKGLPDKYKLTSNEILSAVYYYNSFNDEEMETLLDLIYVEEGSTLNEEVKKGVIGFLEKTGYIFNNVKPYNDNYYKYMIVKQKDFVTLTGTNYDDLKKYVENIYLIKKYRQLYECFEQTLNELSTIYCDVSSPYFSLLYDIGLKEVLPGTKYDEYFGYKHALNDIYKDHFASSINYHYEGEGLIDNKSKPKTYVYCTDTKK